MSGNWKSWGLGDLAESKHLVGGEAWTWTQFLSSKSSLWRFPQRPWTCWRWSGKKCSPKCQVPQKLPCRFTGKWNIKEWLPGESRKGAGETGWDGREAKQGHDFRGKPSLSLIICKLPLRRCPPLRKGSRLSHSSSSQACPGTSGFLYMNPKELQKPKGSPLKKAAGGRGQKPSPEGVVLVKNK